MNQDEAIFRIDQDCQLRLAWVLWGLCEPAPTPGAGPGRWASVQKLRDAVHQVWQESGRQLHGNGPGLKGLPATLSKAVSKKTGRDEWLTNNYQGKAMQENRHSGDYYRLNYSPPERGPLGPVDANEEKQTEAKLLPFPTAADFEAAGPATTANISLDQLESFHGDAITLASLLRRYQGPARAVLARSALKLALELDEKAATP